MTPRKVSLKKTELKAVDTKLIIFSFTLTNWKNQCFKQPID